MYELVKTKNFIEFKNGKSIKPGGEGIYPVYGANGIIGMSNEYREGNSVIIGRVGAYCGSVQFCKGHYWASDNTIVACPKDNNTDVVFLYYSLKNANLNRWAGGAAQPLMTQTAIKQIKLPHPDIDIQRKVSSILSAYDDLIELNERRIKILEEMARLIYKEWFVKFRFPGYKKVKMIESELGMIPERWEVRRLSEVMDFTKGFEPGSKNYSEKELQNSIKFIRVGNLNNLSKDFVYIEKNMSKIESKQSDILISLDGTIGKVDYGIRGAIASGIRKCFSKMGKMYQYQLLKSAPMQGFLRGVSSGGTVLAHAGNHIKNYLLVISKDLQLETKYSKSCDPLFEQCANLKRQNVNLRQTGDMLLPRLISGKIEV